MISHRLGLALLALSIWPFMPLPAQETEDTATAILLLDAAHGGADKGYFRPAGPEEKDVILVATLGIAKALREQGIEFHLTRDADEANPRGRLLADAATYDVDLVVTVHGSAGIRRDRAPVLLYHGKPPGSMRFAERLAEAIEHETGRRALLEPAPEDWFFLNEQSCPAVWLSIGWFEDEEEESLLVDRAYHKQLGTAVALAIHAHGASADEGD